MLQFAPDLDPATPGVLTDVNNIIPTQKGYAGCYTGVNTSYAALAAECRNIVVTRKLDNTSRFFATTQTKIYEGAGGVWASVEAGTPDVGSENRWAFGQFGNYTLATAKSVALQASSSGAFAAVSGAPKASCLAVGQGFVMVGDYNDGTDVADGWYCSAIYDHTDWTPSTTTQCAKGRLVDTPGSITGMIGYGSTFVAFKPDSMYVGSYVGGDSIFQWSLVPGEVGCRSKEAIAQAGPVAYFVGNDNFYLWDGSRPVPIGNHLREWFFKEEVSPSYVYKTIAAYDKRNSFVWFWYVPTGQTTLTKALVFHIPTGRWGKASIEVEAAATYLSDPVTIDGLDSFSATIDGLPDISYDSPFWTSQSQVMAYADTSHRVKSLSGNSVSSSFSTGYHGDQTRYSLVSRINVRGSIAPTSATVQHKYSNDGGFSWSNGASASLSDGKVDLLYSAKLHKYDVSLTGPWDLTEYSAVTAWDGEA